MLYPKIIRFCIASLLLAAPLYAQDFSDFDNIDTLLTDNMLEEAANRYASVILSFQPEQASRLGFSSANNQLNYRTPQQSAQFLAALRAVRESLLALNKKDLSPAKQADYDLLLRALDESIWQEEQHPFRKNPLYYTQAFDAIYDLMLKELTPASRQRQDLAQRLAALSTVATQAEQNLTLTSPYLAQLAMEKAYHAYLSTDEWQQALIQGLQDEDAITQAKNTAFEAKKSVKRLFDIFKQLAGQESTQDFRLGQENYTQLLQTRYQWQPTKIKAFFKTLHQQVQEAQHALTYALEPFLQQLEEGEEEITVITENNELSTEAKTPAPAAKKKTKELIIRNAQDFYAAAKPFLTATPDKAPLQTLQTDTQQALQFLQQQGVLPQKEIHFSMAALPQFYAYTQAFLVLPPFGNQLAPRADFLLRIPQGNERTQQELFNQDFNAPTRKLMISSQLVPGRVYQAQATAKNSAIRRLYPSKSLQNGWTAYAKKLAQQEGYLGLDEDLLFLAWDNYLQALAAWVDAQLHTRQYSYADAMEFLTQHHGLTNEQAEAMIKQITLQPGEAISHYIGLEALENAHRKFSKKYGKKFNKADFNAKLFQIGNVSPHLLEQELTRLYKQEAQQKKAKSSF